MTRFTAYIDALGVAGPGVDSWPELQRLLVNGDSWRAPEDWRPTTTRLSKRDARRLSPQIQLALSVAEQIDAVLPPLAGWVFASSAAEGETLHVILEALCTPELLIQPLRFQNAVHNAAVGQWMIAASRHGPATSIAAYDETFGAGLLKALMQIALEKRPVGLVAFDAPLPPPLDEKRPLGVPLGVGLALSPTLSERTIAVLGAEPVSASASKPASTAGKALAATGNPAAAAMALLELMAARAAGEVVVAHSLGAALRLSITPSEG